MKVYKPAIPVLLGTLSLIVCLSPVILDVIINKGIIMSQNESITWAAIMLGSAAAGAIYGIYLVVIKVSLSEKILIITGILLCLAVGVWETMFVVFLLTGGG